MKSQYELIMMWKSLFLVEVRLASHILNIFSEWLFIGYDSDVNNKDGIYTCIRKTLSIATHKFYATEILNLRNVCFQFSIHLFAYSVFCK